MKIMRQTFLLALLLSVSAALFAGGFALSGIGSRAMSMGGAFRGLADDATAMYWNPAGLAFMDQNELALAVSAIKPNTRWTNTSPLPGFVYNEELSAENKLRLFPSFLAVYGDNPRTKFGMGVYVPYGLGATWDAYKLPTTMPGIPEGATLEWSEGFPEDEMSSSIAIFDVHPTMSYRALDNLSLGMGISMLYGMIDLSQLKPHPTNSYYVPTTFEMSGKGWGFGANLGALYKPTEALSVGLNYRIPSDVPMEGDAEVKTWLSNFVRYSMGGPLEPATLGGKSDIEATLKLPGELGFGLSYKLMPNWSVNLDYAYTMWSRLDSVEVVLKEDIFVGSTTPIDNPMLVFNWENSSRVSFGTEYRMGSSALRGGVYYEQTPIGDETLIPTLADVNDKISGNIGYGMDIGNFTVDVNGQYIMVSEREIPTQTLYNMKGTYNSSVLAGNLGLTYRF